MTVPVPYALDPAWVTRMLWFVDCSAGCRASFASTTDAARWIAANAGSRPFTKAIHIPSGIGALLPPYVKVFTKRRRYKRETPITERPVFAKKESTQSDRDAVYAALRFVIPPSMVEEL